jgi:predicted outer membrane repeat protein
MIQFRGISDFIILCVLYSSAAMSQTFIDVPAGDEAALIAAIQTANETEGEVTIFIRTSPGTEPEDFVFEMPAPGSESALPDITGEIWIFGKATFKTSEDVNRDFRLTNVTGSGFLALENIRVDGFGALAINSHGGAILVTDTASLRTNKSTFVNNLAAGNGGAIAASGEGWLQLVDSNFEGNLASSRGGAVSLDDMSTGIVSGCTFKGNNTSLFGCDINVNSSATSGIRGETLRIKDSALSSSCHSVQLKNTDGVVLVEGSTFLSGDSVDPPAVGSAIETNESGGAVKLFATLFSQVTGSNLQRSTGYKIKPEALCEGSSGLESLGYNIAIDSSCGLDQPTDLPNTNPMVALNADGIPVPQAGSPAIDGGAVEAMVLGDDDLASLPCNYVDLLGTASPQDGNGDGIFECDMGAVEIAGAGDVTDGHSGAFFNASRDGEGTYIEILNDTTAVVYTFTYRPDGSGPAWFIGVGRIEGNSIIIDDLLRPIGTSFGSGFDPADVEFTPIGSMSMVYPNCEAANPGGNVAYTGDVELGYEGLITRATRLSNITGCGSETPHANAGLSGSYFDSARDGEGIIVEWLTSGQVLVVFFTYDQNGNQLWLIGIGTPVGNMVAMDALYASTRPLAIWWRWTRCMPRPTPNGAVDSIPMR